MLKFRLISINTFKNYEEILDSHLINHPCICPRSSHQIQMLRKTNYHRQRLCLAKLYSRLQDLFIKR